jgi:hypothetical protein
VNIPRYFTCPECSRRFDMFDEADADEWNYGHDCEGRDTVAGILARHGVPYRVGPNGLRVERRDT